jgi:hypothetical protein
MYSGTTLTRASGRVMGAHQKIDRIARVHLKKITPENQGFPGIRQILKFEGKNGPDAVKRKSPAQDEPWHYFNPFDDDDTKLVELIEYHYANLVQALKDKAREKASFEAAWLAHALVDGLTPAHHYPYEEKLTEIRGGEGVETRTSIKEKLVMPGDNRRQQLKNNWKMWGPKGLMTAHGMFELGVAGIIAPLRFGDVVPDEQQIELAVSASVRETFVNAAREIAALDMYHGYIAKGWTPKLTWQVRHKLMPIIINNVTLTWYKAMQEAKQ